MELAQFADEEVLEVEPLEVHSECPKGNACEWVIERVKDFCQVVGLLYEG